MDLREARARRFEAGGRHPWERARVALALQLAARHVEIGRGDIVVDVGCGDTFVVEQLARRYPDAHFYAVDSAFTDELMENYRARLGAPNVSLFADLNRLPRERPAALVLLMDVIEHVPDDRRFLAELRDHPCCGIETRILITVPSYAWLFSAHDRFLGHFRRYSSATLKRLLTSARLAPLESGYWFTSLLAIRVLQVARERLFGPAGENSTQLASWRGDEQTARALARVLTLDGGVGLGLSRVGLRLPGLSNFAICRKSA
jgi:hypothetical protein